MDLVVQHAELVVVGGKPLWVLIVDIHDGDTPPHTETYNIVPDAFEWRAAEYDMDPDDPDTWETVLEWVLYEPHAGVQATDPRGLHRAESIPAAREYMKNRIAAVKGRGRVTGKKGRASIRPDTAGMLVLANSGVGDPLDTIRRHSPMSRDHMAVKAEHVARQRRHLARTESRRTARPEGAPVSDDHTVAGWARPTPDELRDELMPASKESP